MSTTVRGDLHLVVGAGDSTPAIRHEKIVVWSAEATQRLLQTTGIDPSKVKVVYLIEGMGEKLEKAARTLAEKAGVPVEGLWQEGAIQAYLRGFFGIPQPPGENFALKYRLGAADAATEAALAQRDEALARVRALDEQVSGLHGEVKGLRHEMQLDKNSIVSLTERLEASEAECEQLQRGITALQERRPHSKSSKKQQVVVTASPCMKEHVTPAMKSRLKKMERLEETFPGLKKKR